MSEYLHGAYGSVQPVGSKVSARSRNAIIYVGTAPVHLTANGAANVNKPVVINNMAEARKLLGYSDDWAKYTLCEAMYIHLEQYGVGPLVMINVLDPATHKAEEGGTASLTPTNGTVTIVNADDIILSSVKVNGKEAGTDYTAAYDASKHTIVISEKVHGGLGTEALSITYDLIDATKVDADDVIGSTDEEGLNLGLYAIKNIYQSTGYIPSYLVAPGFSDQPKVHAVMANVTKKVNGHWDVYMMTDLPVADGESALTISSAALWKKNNGYTQENETVSFPAVKGTDGKVYHLSVLRAAAHQKLLLANDGIPYNTASNTDCPIIENLYLGEAAKNRVYDDEIINDKLNRNGIASAAFVGGRWALWGAHSADYTEDNADSINLAETNRLMLYYLSNDFQHRRFANIDQPMTINAIKAIVAEEQARLDALVKIGALTFGEVQLDASADARSDMIMGDYVFSFRVTTTPLAKSLTANVYWTSEGFTTYFNNFA